MVGVYELRQKLQRDIHTACLAKAVKLRELPVPKEGPSEQAITEFAAWLAGQAAPAANAHVTFNEGPPPLGSSRLVGEPDMPAQMEWPEHNGIPLTFLAQTDLATLPTGIDWPVPKKGWLYFFLGNDDEADNGDRDPGCIRVLYFDGSPAQLKMRPAPAQTSRHIGMKDELPKSAHFSLAFQLGLSVPTGGAGWWAKPWEERFPDIRELDIGNLMFDARPPVIIEARDRMFGLRRDGQSERDSRFEAAAIAAGFGAIVHFSELSLEQFRTIKGRKPVSDEKFEAFKKCQSDLQADAQFWVPLLCLRNHYYIDPTTAKKSSYFNWGDAQTLRLMVDSRRSAAKDFSQVIGLIED